MSDWEKLIERYADGRPICNCRQAYYTPCGEERIVGRTGEPMLRVTGRLACQHGCQANQYAVKDDIAKRVLAELLP